MGMCATSRVTPFQTLTSRHRAVNPEELVPTEFPPRSLSSPWICDPLASQPVKEPTRGTCGKLEN